MRKLITMLILLASLTAGSLLTGCVDADPDNGVDFDAPEVTVDAPEVEAPDVHVDVDPE
jgi:hypothetical protein